MWRHFSIFARNKPAKVFPQQAVSVTRPAGYYISAHDWPVDTGEHGLSDERVSRALATAFTDDRWKAAKQSLRETTDKEWADHLAYVKTQPS